MDDRNESINASYSAIFRSVLQRLIDLTSNDLRDLEKLLKTRDPWTHGDQSKERTMKRERCLKLLSVLQDAIATENKRGLESCIEDDNKMLEREISIARSKTSDRIMKLLKDQRLIEVSEFVEYINANSPPGYKAIDMESSKINVRYPLRGRETEKKKVDIQLLKCYSSKRFRRETK